MILPAAAKPIPNFPSRENHAFMLAAILWIKKLFENVKSHEEHLNYPRLIGLLYQPGPFTN